MRKTFMPLRVRIVSPIAVKPGKLRLIRGGGFPALKATAGASPIRFRPLRSELRSNWIPR